MKIYGQELEKRELLRKVGDISQIGGIRLCQAADGQEKGVRFAEVKNACGIDMRVLIDRGMDISDLRFNSVPIAWKSSVRETSTAYYDKDGLEWLRTFYGGFLFTCGLTTAGMPSVDNGEELGLHGRIGNIASENICIENSWSGDGYMLTIKGTVRESRVYGDCLELTRKIKVPMDKSKVLLNDTVENIGHKTSPLMIIYHMNFGFPLIDKNSYLIEPKSVITPMSDEAEKGLKDCLAFSEPVSGFKEQVYCHEIPSNRGGMSNIALVNEEFNNGNGFGIWLKFSSASLQYLNEWKQMGFGEYVCGLEPANCKTYGRKTSREKNELKFLEPGESEEFHIEVDILENNEEIKKAKAAIK